MRIRSSLWLVAAGVFAQVTVGFNSAALAQQVTGAIFTTDVNSTFVNGNVYDFDEDVYLNGGPRPNAPCTAAGLPDGDYYFQVTDPSGSVLLSIFDSVTDRQVHVQSGLMVANLGTHNTGIGKCVAFNGSNITVQLAPFALTPNPGGEYKVWMTKVSDYAPTSTKGSFGFIPNKSKTDNFKVIPPVADTCDPAIDPSCIVPE